MHLENEPYKSTKGKITWCEITVRFFKEESILFSKLKNRLGRKFQVGEFYKYYTLIKLINQKDFQWQIDTIWERLFNLKPGEECYGSLELLLQAQNVAKYK